jgi:D-alanyl-lipoteichoic acid acyltransferase DltB (MBOAT superfamily)
MLFTDWKFFVFFGVVFAVHWTLSSNTARKAWLLAASAVFYAGWDWRFLGLILFVVLNTYLVTLLVYGNSSPGRRRMCLVVGISVSLSVLGAFKYYNFFIDSLASIIPLGLVTSSIVLPVGISFYTFHSLSYMIDTYRGKIVPSRDLGDVALYILLFPQLVAGPIVRATDLLPQMRERRCWSNVDVKALLALFLIGYFKKAVVSDNLSPVVDSFFGSPEHYGAGDALLAVVLYAVQIYCDFSGYTDMASAVAGLLGYTLKLNFSHPYLAADIGDFWRRWHISLSSWLRDYLYIPLGGNRSGPASQARNVLITMLLGGLWHGASWTFVAWGGLHGLGIVASHAWQSWRSAREPSWKPRYSFVDNVITFAFVCFAWIFFRSPNFSVALEVIDRLTRPAVPTLLPWSSAVVLLCFLLCTHVLFFRVDLVKLVNTLNNVTFACAYGAIVAVIMPMVNLAVQPFIYFQF